MEMRLLCYFLTLADNFSFKQAATEPHLTQLTLSQLNSPLESSLGIPLFDRAGRKTRREQSPRFNAVT